MLHSPSFCIKPRLHYTYGMTKAEAIQNARTIYQLAKLLGIKPQSIDKWKDGPIPQLREYQLREKRPEWFATKKEQK